MPNETLTTTVRSLSEIAEAFRRREAMLARRVIVCAGTGCVANGSLKIHEAFQKIAAERGLNFTIELKEEKQDNTYLSKSGCQGFCQMGPLVTILPENVLYTKVRESDVAEIVDKTLAAGEIIERLLYVDHRTGRACKGQEEIPFYRKQHRMILKECGRLNPEDIEEYIARGGYQAARKAVLEMTPEQVCKEAIDSGLRGRGGGGFPAGKKWDVTRLQNKKKKYVICNGDEGDPGAFMDRSVMEGNPHSVIEGMLIAGRGAGADEGYIYVRAEYPLAVRRMRRAVADAEAMGILGDKIFGSEHSMRLHVMEGAGAFVCGEETALMASIEGKRGMPAPKPPFPAVAGLHGKPTVINNVETLANVSIMMNLGAAEFRKIGTPGSPGTKTFALTGHVVNSGLIEAPFGITLREIIEEIGGGVTDSQGQPDPDGLKAVQIGGPSGACLTLEHFDLPLDFDSLKSVGAMVGSGGLVVLNRDTCMVGFAHYFMRFIQNESCGKCVLCREGTKQLLSLLEDIMNGKGSEEKLALMRSLSRAIQVGSLCGLGKSAPNPVLSTLRYFQAEYDAHVKDKYCPTHNCKALSKPSIDPALCKACGLCKRKCPVGAIEGAPKVVHKINESLCISCGACAAACKFNAVIGA